MKKDYQPFRMICIVCLLAGLILISSCSVNSGSTSGTSGTSDNTIQEYWPTTTWKTKEPDPQIIDVKQLEKVENTVSHSLVQSMIIVHDGYIISEFYKEGDPKELYPLNSVTKSVTSILMGIAMDEGKIKGIDERIENYFPEYEDAFNSDAKKGITVEHLLTMTSGLDWPEWTDWDFSIGPLWNAKDWNSFVLKKIMAFDPGMVWNYNTGGSQLLASILKKPPDNPSMIMVW